MAQTGQLLRSTSELRLAAGTSAMGDGTFRSAVPLLAASVSASPQAVAVVAAGSSAAWFTGLWAGALTDRFPRRSILLWANFGRAASLTVLVGLIAFDKESLVTLVVAAFAVTVGTVFFEAAAQAILPEFVGKDIAILAQQNGRLNMAETAGRSLLGLPLGAFAYSMSAVVPFLTNVATYLWSARAVARLPRTDQVREKRKLWGEIKDGFAYLFGCRTLLMMAILIGMLNFADLMAMSVFVLYAQQVLHASNFLYGLLLAVLAAGSVLGGWLGGRLVARFWWGAVLLGVCLTQAAAWTAVVAAESPGVTFAAFFLIGAGYTVATVCVVATRQAEVPNAMLGRLVTGFRIIGNGASLFGALAGGLVAGQFGLVAAPWCAAALLTAVTVPILIRLARRR